MLLQLQQQITFNRVIMMRHVQLYVSSCIDQSGENMFDFNSSQRQQAENFKATLINLELPAPGKQIYYFLHQAKLRLEDKFIYIEKSIFFISNFNQSHLDQKKYILVAGVRLFYKKNEKGSTELLMNYYKASEIPTKYGNFEVKEESLPYIVVKSFGNGYPLKRGQCLKLGRVEYELVEVQSQPSKEEYIKSLGENEVYIVQPLVAQKIKATEQMTSTKSCSTNEKPACRICLTNDEDESDRLIHPCKCQSSIGSIHIGCFCTWMNMRISKMKGESENGGAYHTSLLTCEICKAPVPKAIKVGSQIIPILNFIDNFKPYIGLAQRQCLPCTKQPPSSETVYITMDQDNKASIGRLLENPIVIQELTVSRKHAMIQINDKNKFIIKDTNSKFGTLIYDKQAQIKLTKHLKAFQVKNTVFAFTLERVG